MGKSNRRYGAYNALLQPGAAFHSLHSSLQLGPSAASAKRSSSRAYSTRTRSKRSRKQSDSAALDDRATAGVAAEPDLPRPASDDEAYENLEADLGQVPSVANTQEQQPTWDRDWLQQQINSNPEAARVIYEAGELLRFNQLSTAFAIAVSSLHLALRCMHAAHAVTRTAGSLPQMGPSLTAACWKKSKTCSKFLMRPAPSWPGMQCPSTLAASCAGHSP